MNIKPGEELIRGSEIHSLAEVISSTGCVIIVGMAGVGKTSLAISLGLLTGEVCGLPVLHFSCREGWDDRDFYAELQNRLCVFTGSTGTRSVEPGVRPVLTMREERPLVLLIDDFQFVENSETLELLQAGTSLRNGHLVVLSRKKPSLDALTMVDVYTHVLKGLEPVDNELLVRILFQSHGLAEPGPETLNAITELSQGHAHSTKLLCGLLISGKITVADLGYGGKAYGQMEEYLTKLILDSLSDKTKDVMSVLSVFRIPVDKDLVNTLAGEDTAFVLDELNKYCIADFDLSGMISLQALISRFIQKIYHHGNLSGLHLRAAKVLIEQHPDNPEALREAYFHFYRSGEREKSIDTLLELADLNLYLQEISKDVVHLLKTEVSFGEHRVNDLRAALVDQLILQSRFEEAKQELAELQGAERFFQEANLHFRQGCSSSAVELYRKSISGLSDERKIFFARMRIANSKAYLGRLGEAEQDFIKLSESPSLKHYPLLKAVYQVYHAVFCQMQDRYEQALVLVEAALGQGKSFPHSWLPYTHYLKALLLFGLNRSAEAENSMQDSEESNRELGDNLTRAAVLLLSGEIYSRKGEPEKAIEVLMESLQLCRRLGMKPTEAYSLCGIAVGFSKSGRSSDAEHYFQEALTVLGGIENLVAQISIRCSYAEFLLLSNCAVRALEVLKHIEGKLEEAGYNSSDACLFFFLTGKALRTLGKNSAADEYTSRAKAILSGLKYFLRENVEERISGLERSIDELSLKIRVILSGNEPKLSGPEATADLRERCGEFELFADFAGSKLFVDGMEVDFFRRKTHVKLLQEFSTSPGQIRSAAEIYPKVWERNFDPQSDATTFRMNISRLRKILDPQNTHRFIEGTDDSHCYRLNPKINYCIIMPAN
ncbi:MAG: tetratricopeptide repeat protein [Candidatus Wallbacteria bacterium]|nr:tetratricopeptide repeat protein [Candidatus Wallbacteria bacterium]